MAIFLGNAGYAQDVTTFDTAPPTVPSISYPDAGNYPGQGGWTPYGSAPPQPTSAATPTTTFGLPPVQNPNSRQTTVFSPPTNIENLSPPTINGGSLGTTGTNLVAKPGSYSLSEVEDPQSTFYGGGQTPIQNARDAEIIDEATAVGERAGYGYEVQQLNSGVMAYSSDLDQRFNFSKLRNGYLMPPVIEEVDSTSQSCGVNCIYMTSGEYRIVSNAYVSAHAPTWKDYLILKAPDIHIPAGIPSDASKSGLWKRTVDQAWKKGIARARAKFLSQFNLLNRDYAGMIRFYTLEQEGAVSMPMVSIVKKAGVIYVNGTAAAKDEVHVSVTVAPQFQNPSAIASSYAPSSDIP